MPNRNLIQSTSAPSGQETTPALVSGPAINANIRPLGFTKTMCQ
jgi:hypothetical protein